LSRVLRALLELPLGWMQLKHQKLRLLVALSGIAFAVILILVQLGFRASLFESAVRYHQRLHYDIALFSTESSFIALPKSFSSRRLYQALGLDGVAAVSPVYIYRSFWKNPYDHQMRNALTLGIDPADDVLDAPGVKENLHHVRRRDAILFDGASRDELGPIAERFAAGEAIETEVNDRQVQVAGIFTMGPSFGIDGSLLTSVDNFLRLFPERRRTQIDLGLVVLEPGRDPEAMRDQIAARLPDDVLVLTKADFIRRERDYWNSTTPIGYVFAFGAVIGFVVGAIIVYQILFADVSDHLAEYATLKAMGYSNGFVSGVVVQQAVILAVLGYLPGLAASAWLYRSAGAATRLPMHLTSERCLAVLALTVAMCAVSGLIALRKVRSLDPAEIF
jgi:putative ABC transport system permease protein